MTLRRYVDQASLSLSLSYSLPRTHALTLSLSLSFTLSSFKASFSRERNKFGNLFLSSSDKIFLTSGYSRKLIAKKGSLGGCYDDKTGFCEPRANNDLMKSSNKYLLYILTQEISALGLGSHLSNLVFKANH